MKLAATGTILLLACVASCKSTPATTIDSGPSDGAPPDAAARNGDATDVSVAPSRQDHHALVISIDGLHGADLERFIGAHPQAALAVLAANGVRYTHARAPLPSDSFPGTLALVTGGTPASTGVYYDLSYDRTLSPPGSDCSMRGTRVDFTEAADLSSKALDGGGGLNLNALPRDPARGCAVVMPHDYLRVNTVFDVAKAAGYRTAWSAKHLSYEILQGSTGHAVDDLWTPEIAAKGVDKTVASTEAYDDAKVMGVINQIHGMTHDGAPATVPGILGLNFQAVSVAQKLPTGGYADAAGSPSAELEGAIEHTDASVARLVSELQTTGLWPTTTVIVVAAHGQAPVDRALLRTVPTTALPSIVNGLQAGLLAAATEDDIALLWLTDSSMASRVADAIMAHSDETGTESVLWGAALAQQFPDPVKDARTPDLLVRTKPGVIFLDSSPPTKIAEHGGFSDDDRSVALMVVAPGITPSLVDTPVETRQVAPTLLRALGLDPQQLDAVQQEGTVALVGLP